MRSAPPPPPKSKPVRPIAKAPPVPRSLPPPPPPPPIEGMSNVWILDRSDSRSELLDSIKSDTTTKVMLPLNRIFSQRHLVAKIKSFSVRRKRPSQIKFFLIFELRYFLQKVDKDEVKPTLGTDARSDLLSQIRQGCELKPVSQEPKSALENADITEVGIRGALLRALKLRANDIHSDSEDSSSESCSDDDWDD